MFLSEKIENFNKKITYTLTLIGPKKCIHVLSENIILDQQKIDIHIYIWYEKITLNTHP